MDGCFGTIRFDGEVSWFDDFGQTGMLSAFSINHGLKRLVLPMRLSVVKPTV